MDSPSEQNPKKNRFENGYFRRQHKNRLVFSGSDKPILYSTWRRKLAKKSHGRLLEVGCSEGNFLRRAKSDFSFAGGADISAEGLKAAARHGLALTRTDAQNLPYKNASFDFLVAFGLVEYLPDPGKFFVEAVRVLKKGGAGIDHSEPGKFGQPAEKGKLFRLYGPDPLLHKKRLCLAGNI